MLGVVVVFLPHPPHAAVVSPLTQLVIQAVAVGLPWAFLHCPAMCGPVVVAFRLGRGAGPLAVAGDLLAYQGGRLLVYAPLGAAAGWAGGMLSHHLVVGQRVMGTAAAVILVASALHALRWVRLPGLGFLAPLFRSVDQGCARHPRVRAGVLGLLAAGLPCGIVFWLLGLAALSASAWGGALLMALIPLLSLAPLLLAALVPDALRLMGLRAPRWIVPLLLVASAGWVLYLAWAAGAGHCAGCA